MYYYVAGFPYSDELYHHGTQGQKWGLRRYQNEDGSLTPLGRVHYGYGKAKEAAKQVAKTASKVAVKSTLPIRKRHTWMLSNNELDSLRERELKEAAYREAKSKNRSFIKKSRFGKTFGDIIESGAKTIAARAFNEMANNLFEDKTDWRDVLNHPNDFSDKKVKAAVERRNLEKALNTQYADAVANTVSSDRGKALVNQIVKAKKEADSVGKHVNMANYYNRMRSEKNGYGVSKPFKETDTSIQSNGNNKKKKKKISSPSVSGPSNPRPKR